MGTKAVRQYHRNQAKSVVDGLGRILKRINSTYTPAWMIHELHEAYNIAQCIQAEAERVMKGFGDEI